MIGPGARVGGWAIASAGALVVEGLGGMGFLGQPVELPLWALLLVFALPMEAIVALVMRVSGSRRYQTGELDQPEADDGRVEQ